MFTKFMKLKELFSGKSTETDYAQSVAENIQIIDDHDHSGGKGKPIPLTALQADSDLDLQSNAVVDVKALNMSQAEISTIPNNSVFVDGGDLYWKNSAGNIVRITNDNNLAGLSPQGEGFTDDFTDAVLSGRNLRLIRRNGTILSVTLPSTQESTNDFVSAALVQGKLRLTRRDGSFQDVNLPSTAESQDDFVNVDFSSGVLTLTKRDSTTESVTIPGQSDDDFVNASISGQVLTLTKRSGDTVTITIPTNVVDPASITESQDDFTQASISNGVITLTKRNGDTVDLNLPTESQDDFTDASLSSNVLTLTKRDGSVTNLTFPVYTQDDDDYINASLSSNVITLTKRSGDETQITLPTFSESQNDIINVTLSQKTLIFTKRDGSTLSIVLPDTGSGTIINVDELVSKTIGGDYSSDSNATVNYSTSNREYTFKSTSTILSTLVAKGFTLLNSSNSNRKVAIESNDAQTQDYSVKMFSGLPTGSRAVFINSSGELTAKRVEAGDIETGVIPDAISNSYKMKKVTTSSTGQRYGFSNMNTIQSLRRGPFALERVDIDSRTESIEAFKNPIFLNSSFIFTTQQESTFGGNRQHSSTPFQQSVLLGIRRSVFNQNNQVFDQRDLIMNFAVQVGFSEDSSQEDTKGYQNSFNCSYTDIPNIGDQRVTDLISSDSDFKIRYELCLYQIGGLTRTSDAIFIYPANQIETASDRSNLVSDPFRFAGRPIVAPEPNVISATYRG